MSQPPYQPYQPEPQPGQPGYAPPTPPGGQGYPPPANQGFGGPPPANQGFGGPPPAGQGFGDAPPPPPKKRSVWKILLLVVAIVVVLCAGGIGTLVYLNRDTVKDVVEASKIKVVEPATLGTLPKTTEPNLNSGLQTDITSMKKDPTVTGTVGAIYGNAKTLDVVMVEAASSVGGSARQRFDALNKNIAGFGITDLKDVDGGPLGGIAKCGNGKASSIPLAVCLWTDSGSFGLIVQFKKTATELQKSFVSYRGQIEQKS
jgi:hypothetical protein